MRSWRVTSLTAVLSVGLVLGSVALAVAQSNGDATTDATAALGWALVPDLDLGTEAVLSGIASSPDGVTVIVGADLNEALVLRTTDGMTWDRIAIPGPEVGTPGSITTWGGGFVAVGAGIDDKGRPTGLVWTSPDGLVWNEPTTIEDASPEIVVSTPTGGLAIAGREYGKKGRSSMMTWTSDDAVSWAGVDAPRARLFTDLAISPGGIWLLTGGDFVPSGWVPHLWRSEDGISWHAVEPADAPAKGASFVGTGPIAVDGDDFLLSISTGTRRKNRFAEYVGSIWRSSDGSEWEKLTETDRPITAIAVSPTDTYAFTFPYLRTAVRPRSEALDPVILTSPDGSSWAVRRPEVFARAGVLKANTRPDGTVIAIGRGGPAGGPALVWTSDGAPGE